MILRTADWCARGLALLGVLVLSTASHAVEVDPRFDVRLVKDIDQNASSYGSMPHSFTAVGDTVYFVAGGLSNGDQLWVTSGDAASTHEVSPGFKVGTIVESGGRLFMPAEHTFSDYGLWSIDPAGGIPYLVKDMHLASSIARMGDFFDFDGKLIFFAEDSAHGIEPWVSQGTGSTTALLVDTIQGSQFAVNTHPVVQYGARAYFTSNFATYTGAPQTTWWTTDGTAAGTVPLHSFSSTAIAGNLFQLKGKLCLVVAEPSPSTPELWCTNGAQADTTLAAILSDITINLIDDKFVANADGAYFKAHTATSGEELWVTDGTAAGTRPVSNFPEAAPDVVEELINVSGKIYFTATTDSVTTRLWVVDEGARSVTALTPVATTDEQLLWPRLLTNFNGTLAFLGRRLNSDEEIWKSDGTPTGTKRLAHFDFHPSWPMLGMVALGQSLYFDGDGGEGREPWIWANRRPQARVDSFQLANEDWMTLDVLANDSDVDGALAPDSIEIVSQPSYGQAEVLGGRIRYKPVSAMSRDSFSYRVRDTQGGISDTVTANVAGVGIKVADSSGGGAINSTWLYLLLCAGLASLATRRRNV
jgi:ELWxxDGT repeat protein